MEARARRLRIQRTTFTAGQGREAILRFPYCGQCPGQLILIETKDIDFLKCSYDYNHWTISDTPVDDGTFGPSFSQPRDKSVQFVLTRERSKLR